MSDRIHPSRSRIKAWNDEIDHDNEVYPVDDAAEQYSELRNLNWDGAPDSVAGWGAKEIAGFVDYCGLYPGTSVAPMGPTDNRYLTFKDSTPTLATNEGDEIMLDLGGLRYWKNPDGLAADELPDAETPVEGQGGTLTHGS